MDCAKIARIGYLILAASISACTTPRHTEALAPSSAVAQLATYEKRDGALDAEKDFRNGKVRFLAVQGYALTVPGIDDFFPKLSHTYKYHVIEGTSDVIQNSRDLQLQATAESYARAYNLKLARLLGFDS
jgi:hypothetical protein